MDKVVLVLLMAAVVTAFVRSIVWMQRDLAERTASGDPVVVRLGSLEISTVQQWTIALVIAWGVAFPVYLYARSHV